MRPMPPPVITTRRLRELILDMAIAPGIIEAAKVGDGGIEPDDAVGHSVREEEELEETEDEIVGEAGEEAVEVEEAQARDALRVVDARDLSNRGVDAAEKRHKGHYVESRPRASRDA